MKWTYSRKWKLMGLSVCLVAGGLTTLFLHSEFFQGDVSARGDKNMNTAKELSAQERTVPPIDAAAPAATETATFAFG